VHLHPDLQSRFVQFLIELTSTNKFTVIIATHSTAILGALFNYNHSRFAVLTNGSSSAAFRPINSMYQDILPVFGANPLSNVFNQSPIFLVEGEDDVRIFQQAIRTSNGQLRINPCSVDGNGNLAAYETAVVEILNGVYDNAKAYSLRDRDEGDENINDSPPLVRFKTSCRAVENLILCDEVLSTIGTTWAGLEAETETWLTAHGNHEKHQFMQQFKTSGYNRKGFDLKEIRNILIASTGTTKPWEVIVGQTIARLVTGQIPKDFSDHKLANYLGVKLTNVLRP
jgi:energy-coupling factor transporter ATP-binding protein EcfA2